MKYKMKDMTGTKAKEFLASIISQLDGIDENDMTTLELHILHKAITKPPKKYYGAENQINNGASPM